MARFLLAAKLDMLDYANNFASFGQAIVSRAARRSSVATP